MFTLRNGEGDQNRVIFESKEEGRGQEIIKLIQDYLGPEVLEGTGQTHLNGEGVMITNEINNVIRKNPIREETFFEQEFMSQMDVYYEIYKTLEEEMFGKSDEDNEQH